MRIGFYILLVAVILIGCEKTEVTAISAISADLDAYQGRDILIEGVHVARNGNSDLVSASQLIDFISIEDGSGRIDVWYNTVRTRCAPRIGSRVSAVGKVTDVTLMDTHAAKIVTRRAFVAGSFSIEDAPPMANNEVRLCRLSLQEQQMFAMEGPEALANRWSAAGRSARTVVVD